MAGMGFHDMMQAHIGLRTVATVTVNLSLVAAVCLGLLINSLLDWPTKCAEDCYSRAENADSSNQSGQARASGTATGEVCLEHPPSVRICISPTARPRPDNGQSASSAATPSATQDESPSTATDGAADDQTAESEGQG